MLFSKEHWKKAVLFNQDYNMPCNWTQPDETTENKNQTKSRKQYGKHLIKNQFKMGNSDKM